MNGIGRRDISVRGKPPFIPQSELKTFIFIQQTGIIGDRIVIQQILHQAAMQCPLPIQVKFAAKAQFPAIEQFSTAQISGVPIQVKIADRGPEPFQAARLSPEPFKTARVSTEPFKAARITGTI